VEVLILQAGGTALTSIMSRCLSPPTIGAPPTFAEGEGSMAHLSGYGQLKGKTFGICWMEGLPPKIPDSCGMFMLGRSTMLKVKKRLAELDHYAREVLRANELPYMAAL
jgi:hypothetical protein